MPIGKNYQTGVTLIVTLIALVILLIASVALIRSTDTSLLVAGHLGFKRDLTNQAERTFPVIKNIFKAGTLSTSSTRSSDLVTSNYYASIQPSDKNGIPNVLLDTSTFDSTFTGNNIVDTTAKITIRYLIDRMCLTTGAVSAASCSLSLGTTDPGGDINQLLNKPGGVDRPIYRISMRVSGPRNTEAFLQSTFTID